MLKTIEKKINISNPPRVLLIFGEEEFLVDEAVKTILDKLSKLKTDWNEFERYDGENINLGDLADMCSTVSLLTPQKTILVKNFEKMVPKANTKKNFDNSPFGKYLKHPSENTFLILQANHTSLNGLSKKVKKLNFPFDILIEKYPWFEFAKVWPNEYPKWIESRASSLNMKISPQAAEMLITKAGDSLRSLNNELDKLQISLDDKDLIQLEDVLRVTGSSKESTVFDLQKYIGKKNLKDAVKTMIDMLEVDRQEMLTITILQRFFITLWKLSEEDLSQNKYALAAKTGINAFFLSEYLDVLRRYSPAQIANALAALQEADEKLKSSGSDNLFLMINAIRKIINGYT
ncbi:MAG: DNA polymerase III subunit delta [Ignavibacteria bacterium GWF2_33_9]|nr:MAG: DNA polymerase III subunit delta [Ignavibacteria bacterium GWF2_33_9]